MRDLENASDGIIARVIESGKVRLHGPRVNQEAFVHRSVARSIAQIPPFQKPIASEIRS